MRFIIGLLLGLGIGFSAALLLAPERGRLREGAPSPEETTSEGFGRRFGSARPMRIATEASTHSPWVSALLEDTGHEVMVANPPS